MIVLVAADGQPAQQLLVTKRSTIGAVQALLGLRAEPTAIEWLIEDGTWAPADPDARLYDLAGDLQGDGSSGKKAFRVRTVVDDAAEQGELEYHAGTLHLPPLCMRSKPSSLTCNRRCPLLC